MKRPQEGQLNFDFFFVVIQYSLDNKTLDSYQNIHIQLLSRTTVICSSDSHKHSGSLEFVHWYSPHLGLVLQIDLGIMYILPVFDAAAIDKPWFDHIYPTFRIGIGPAF